MPATESRESKACITDLYQKKGDAAICSSSRGLLISDHLAKAYIGKLRDEVADAVKRATPSDQFGGCTGGGTDYPVHVMKSVIDYAARAALSVFILFVDLVAAYDSVVREIALGVPHSHAGDQLEYLVNLGVGKDSAAFIVDYIATNLPVLEQFDVDPKVVRMINALHAKSWARYGDLPSIIVGFKGGARVVSLAESSST